LHEFDARAVGACDGNAHLVGHEHVIAGVDCGFATFAGAPTVVLMIAWAKLGALAEGACFASQKLWARPT